MGVEGEAAVPLSSGGGPGVVLGDVFLVVGMPASAVLLVRPGSSSGLGLISSTRVLALESDSWESPVDTLSNYLSVLHQTPFFPNFRLSTLIHPRHPYHQPIKGFFICM